MDKELHILIVEDVASDVELVVRELVKEELAHTTKLVKSKDEFIKALEEYMPDIILCDYIMPDFGAPAALEILKKSYPETPLIVVSGAIGEDVAVETLKLGAADYVMKDKILRLASAVKRALKENEERVDRKKTEDRLKEAYNTLRDTQSQLIHAEKMDAIGRMASGVAHEVKNPLGIILQGINYLEQTIPSKQKDEHEMLHIMKNSIKRADSIVSALLDFSKSGALSIKPESINSMIEIALNLVEHKMKIKDIKVSQELEKGLLEVLADRGKVEQVFLNLMNNAIDAMPEGGSLHIRSYMAGLDNSGDVVRDKKDVISKSEEEVVVVEIEDTGVGMNEDVKKQLFDPFFTTKNRAERTGLGLSVVKNIIDIHKGTINVESKEGKGTKFTMIFKISGGGCYAKKRVMIVGDEKDFHKTTKIN